MLQDGLLDHHQVLPCQDHLTRQAGADPGDPGMHLMTHNISNLYVEKKSAISRLPER